MSRKRRDVTQRQYAKEVVISVYAFGFISSVLLGVSLQTGSISSVIFSAIITLLGLGLAFLWYRAFPEDRKMFNQEPPSNLNNETCETEVVLEVTTEKLSF